MPLKFTDLPMFATPFVPVGTGLSMANAAYANVLQDAQQREMRRYHDILKEQEDRRMASVETAQRDLNAREKRRMALDILKTKMAQENAQKDAQEKALLESQKLAITNPMAAQALLANRGMLASRAAAQPMQNTAQPVQQPVPGSQQIQLPQSAITAGINPEDINAALAPLRQMKTPTMQTEGTGTGTPIAQQSLPPIQQPVEQPPPDQYSVESGGQTFDFSAQGELEKRSAVVEDLFTKLVEGAPEKNAEVAKQVLHMAPVAVKATQGDTQKAAGMLLDLYEKTIPKKAPKKKGIGPGKQTGKKRSAGKKWFEAYKFGYNKAESFLQKNKYIDQIKALDDVKLAKKKLLTGGSTDHKEAIILMARALQGGRLTDKDIEIAEGFKSLQQEVERFFSTKANKEAKLPPSIIKPLIRALNNTMRSKYENIKVILDTLKGKRESAQFKEEEDGVNAFLEPELDRFPDLMERNVDKSADKESKQKSLAQQMADKYGQK